MKPAEREDEDMEEQENHEEDTTPAFIDHPQVPTLLQREFRCVCRLRGAQTSHCRDAHETLHALPLRLVSL